MGGNRAPGSTDRAIASLAGRQYGIVARRQLLQAGLSGRAIECRAEAGRLHRLHYGVYAVGHQRLPRRGWWLAAVLTFEPGALLSHRSAAALWGLMRSGRGPIEVSVQRARPRQGILIHQTRLHRADRAVVDGIPVTSVARTLFDLAEIVDEQQLERALEEADRLRLLRMPELEAVWARSQGRRALRPIRRLIDEAQAPGETRSPLEDRVLGLCREFDLPLPVTNVEVLGHGVDALWPSERLVVEADGYAYHRHRAAFERDRLRDAAMQAEGYRVLRVTHRRLVQERHAVAKEIRRLLVLGGRQRGQGTVEWIGLLAVVALLVLGLVAAGVRVPGTALARALASRMLCAVAMADGCGDEPVLIAAYGTEVGKLVRRHMPTIVFERGSRAMPVDFRRCRSSSCGDGSARGFVHASDAGLPVTAFVRVIDCREKAIEATEVADANCSGSRAGNLYLQYWTYYADSATLRGVPIAGAAGYHRDDWEGVQIRIGPEGQVDERASSHHGYNYAQSVANMGSDAGIAPLNEIAEVLGARPDNGWGPETRMLVVSGGSHAGNADGFLDSDRVVLGRRVHLIPLESIAAGEGDDYRFAVNPPWRKKVWRDPEAAGTD